MGGGTAISAMSSSFIRLIHSSPSRGPALTVSSGSFCTVFLVTSSYDLACMQGAPMSGAHAAARGKVLNGGERRT